MVQNAIQLETLLVTGDFIALPLGVRPHNTSQVSLFRVAPAQNGYNDKTGSCSTGYYDARRLIVASAALWHLHMPG